VRGITMRMAEKTINEPTAPNMIFSVLFMQLIITFTACRQAVCVRI
jgi:hypothetical protein